MRVLFVIGTTGGGVGRHVRALCEQLATAGHQVTVAGPAATDADLGFSGVGVRFEAVEVRDRPHPVGDWRAVRRLSGLVRDVDVVHAHGLRAGGLSVLARRGRGPAQPPVVVTLHNAAPTSGSAAVRAAYAVLERLVARRADAALGVSADLVERMSALGARRTALAVVPAPPARQPSQPPEWTRATLGLGADRPVVLTVARLAAQKGLPLLLDVARRLQDHQPLPVFLVAGDGPLREELERAVDSERLPVRLLGARSDVPELLAAADVALSTAVWEGQPIFVQEALRAGLPLVATDVGGTAAATGGAALLAGYGDADGLAAAVRGLLDDPARRAERAQASLARAAELPTDTDARDAVLGLYRALGADD